MSLTEEFRRRASFEARRYGGDPWVFIRELLQNSRDAGASRIDLQIERRDGVDRVVCIDDGCGMSFDHARKYLFTLYSSSKAAERDSAGRFGIGFWSVLRFQPDEVVVCSAPVGGPAWRLRFSGDLERVDRDAADLVTGTRVELARASIGGDPVAAVWRAARRDARHLRRRGKGRGVLDVRVNSRRVTSEIRLEAPSLTLVRSKMRAAVALADRPSVDLLAHGLRVRTAATLDELLTRPEGRRRRAPAAPSGLLPMVVLDSSRLQVLMARGDARTDRELRRLVAFGRRGIRRLVREQLDTTTGLDRVGRAAMRARELMGSPWARRLAAVVALAAAAVGVWKAAGMAGIGEGNGFAAPTSSSRDSTGVSGLLADDAVRRYRGPSVSGLGARIEGFELGYRPVSSSPLLAVFRVRSMDDDGRVTEPPADRGHRPYVGAMCRERCLEITLELDEPEGAVRLPVPTGHVLDPDSVSVEGGSARLWATADGIPLLEPTGGTVVRVDYRTSVVRENPTIASGVWPSLPVEANDVAAGLRRLSPALAASAAEDWVRRRVAYDTSADTMVRHREAALSGLGFAERCLEVGAGDCDVQNALVAAMLHRAGFDVRMAVGMVGSGGRALTGLHAWVEYAGADGVWRVADASRGAVREPETTTGAGGAAPGGAGRDAGIRSSGGAKSGSFGRDIRYGMPVAVIGLVGLCVLAVLVVRRRRETTTLIDADDDADLAGLLRGALTTPDAFGEIPALFDRPVVPLIDASFISLSRARFLGRRGLLAVGSPSTGLSRAAVERGGRVIDGERAEGMAVAASLGAVDLDRWDRIMAEGCRLSLTRRFEDEVGEAGEDWTVVCSDVVDEIDVLEGPLTGRSAAGLMVAVGGDSHVWRAVIGLAGRAPAAALLLLAERVLENSRVPSYRRRRLLSRLAAAAVVEREGDRL